MLEPIRAELFGAERLIQHAANLAAAQQVTRAGQPGRALAPRVQENRRVLREAHRLIADAVRDGLEITPAAEWLVDNFHVVDEQLREIRDDLPEGFYRELPKLADGPLAGYPRVYGLAWAFVAHTDSRFEPDTLRRFVRAYQSVEPLTIGELWAVAITLRVVLVENLRRLADAIVQTRKLREAADTLADELLTPGRHPVEWLTSALDEPGQGQVGAAFIVELVQRLRHHDPAVTPAVVWLNQRIAMGGTTPEEVVRLEHQHQAATTVTVRNVITSMRLMSAVDWSEFFESVSLVDDVLRGSGCYAAMDFASRDVYRHAIEELARGSGHPELDIARAAMERAGGGRADVAPDSPIDAEREQDPGCYLIGSGRRAFETELGFRPHIRARLRRAYIAAALPGYLGSIFVVTAFVLAIALLVEALFGISSRGLLALGALAAIPASDLGVALVNRAVTTWIPPRVMPRLELREGIPSSRRTMVAVPMLLTTPADIAEAVERLEVHYLANPDGDVYFALLSDWMDAGTQQLPDDATLHAAAIEGIGRLNQRHGNVPGGGERFLLLHRNRRWNDREGVWMGWERKRGKLHELNRLLRGVTDTTFVGPDGAPPAVPSGVQFVVTLDADTRLPMGAVRRLVGTMAHPLNRPRLDPATRRVVEGHAVLQPRVTPPLPARESSAYQRLSSAPPGIDPYAMAVSDVYQDLFDEGSYAGKGVYDVDAFSEALADRAPPNRLLSHDLFEGIFARTGWVSDIEVFETVPGHYGLAAARQHRWARGDWQLLPWIFDGSVPALGRWKMLDNLRRTMVAPTAWFALVAGWLLPHAAPAVWTALVLLMLAIPPCIPAVATLFPRRRDIAKRSYAGAVLRDFARAGEQVLLTLTLLADQAALMLDAAIRTLGRLWVTHRHLLEWVTAAQAEAGVRHDLAGFYRRMQGGVALAAIALAAIIWREPSSLPVALPFLGLWLASPVVARAVSTPNDDAHVAALTPGDAVALRLIARRTWEFFARFVGTDDNALPPDNVQETPRQILAHRTSPTNMGFYLLSVVAARDLGWIGTLDTVDRLDATLRAMGRLQRYRGHFYNWYDTADSRPLDAKYVSTVDSGNLAACLITLARACQELIDEPLQDLAVFAGTADAAALLRESLQPVLRRGVAPSHDAVRLDEALRAVIAATDVYPETPSTWSADLAALTNAVQHAMDLATAHAAMLSDADGAEMRDWTRALADCMASHVRDRAALYGPGAATAREALARRVEGLIRQMSDLVKGMEFGFLFDPLRKLFSIGFRIDDGTLDPGRYDLLASEARLTSLVAIAKGDVPVSHWFHLGRPLTPMGRDSVLLSWSGSMFEYLMPEVMMRSPSGSLLEHSCRLVVRRQMAYGSELGTPWGISESGYSARDFEQTYQYSHFGVPGLGLRRGLSADVVIAPYATGLAVMFDPVAALRNFRRLATAGALGRYGFYEAMDYTPSRLHPSATVAVVRSYMAHHEAMLLLAISNVLSGGGMRERFHTEPMIQACEMLLQERTPHDVAVARPQVEDVAVVRAVGEALPPIARTFGTPHTALPRTHLLSNGRYAVMLTNAGSGFSRCGDLAVTRWREDPTCDVGGVTIFVRDRASGARWTAGCQLDGDAPGEYSAAFYEDRAELSRKDDGITTHLEVIVSPEDDVELRRISLANLGSRTRELEVTSYAEVVLAPQSADAAHPAFSNLFVETECIPGRDIVLASRRPRSPDEAPVWLAHALALDADAIGEAQWETDRARFIGRGRDIRNPAAVASDQPLSNTTGAVLDPVVSLRRRVRLKPGERAQLVFSTLIASSRDDAVRLADKYHDPATFERAATMAWSQAQVQLQHIGIDADDAQLFQSIAGDVLFLNRRMRAPATVLARQSGGQGALWSHAISGDLPIVLVHVDEPEDVGIVRSLLLAHEYWRMKRLSVDLVILNDRAPSYIQDLQSLLETLVRASPAMPRAPGQEPQGKVFVLRADQMSAADRDVLEAVARVVFSSRRGTLVEQMQRGIGADTEPSRASLRGRRPIRDQVLHAPVPDLEFFNGLGGFGRDGREYVILLGSRDQTPVPWINAIANPTFGFLVSESGSGYTWALNSQMNKLTSWSNDPVCDPPAEVLYVRDDETGELWGPTALPIREAEPYTIRHGQGYSRFEHESHGIALELVQCVASGDPVKLSRLTLTNRSGSTRRLSVTAYVEWVLGVSRAASAPFVITERDPVSGAIFARSAWNRDFESRIAFLDIGGLQTGWTGDRAEFLGRHGSMARPAALTSGAKLSGRVGAALDPCAALQSSVVIPVGGSVSVTVLLGQTDSREAATALIRKYRSTGFEHTLREGVTRWDELLGTFQVTTPDRAMDLLVNRWLLYQTLSCRIWARAGFYQASGGYGFRDQLQDVMALAAVRPDLTRRHLLLAAERQFLEGDVQHWWHPPSGRGVRTRISDDLLWLPFAAGHYVRTTGDRDVLGEPVPFLEGPSLVAGQAESYFEPRVSESRGTLYEHCARAIDRSLAVGQHGLSLMGTGDWNDGMNRVGAQGLGESVWLAWFLLALLPEWAGIAETRGDGERVERWRQHAGRLRESVEAEAWDGQWYRRAWFDDGTVLGSAVNDECQIDSIAQSWSVISRAGDAVRSRVAMTSLETLLVKRADAMVLLLTPPFDATSLAPGYIKGYLPGVRENGGQYTHAAIWAAIAFAELGCGARAGELFRFLNPITHSSAREDCDRYKVEPYVMVADVYGRAPHVGRGGWTWYTGSAGWMYRAGIEWILGIRLQHDRMIIDPCIPPGWPGFTVMLRARGAEYKVVVENPRQVARGVKVLELDGAPIEPGEGVPLGPSAVGHLVRVVLG